MNLMSFCDIVKERYIMAKRDFPSKQEIEAAVKAVIDRDGTERKLLIERSLTRYGYSAAELKDRSCESLNTRLKSLTGVVLNEMLAAGTLATTEDGRLAPPKPVQETKGGLTRTQRRRAQRKRAAERASKLPKYPDSPLGKALEGADDKFQEYKAGKLTKDKYLAALRRALTRAISEAGGEFFEQLSMKLLLAVYGDTVTRNELTAGPDDNGIDGKLYIQDPVGFKETVFFQSKTKLNERAYVSVKVVREFLGVMTAWGATKGILITNSNFHRDTKSFAAKRGELMLIDNARLLDLMFAHGVGVRRDDGVPHIDDDFFLMPEKGGSASK